MGSNKTLILDYTYFMNRNTFQNYTINENNINGYNLEYMLNNTSNEYTLQGAYNANSYIGTITELPQVYLAIYDTDIIVFSYTGRGNIDITDNQISLNVQITINDEVVLYPRNYDGSVFEMLSGGTSFAFRQNNPWRTANDTILFINKIMHFLWGLFNSIFL